MNAPEPVVFGVTGVAMSKFTKGTFATLLIAVTFSASADISVISKQEFNAVLAAAQAAYVAENFELASNSYEKAAKWGDKYSQYVLGTMYSSGKGVEKSAETAYAWLHTAAESRNKDYRRAAKQLAKSMSATEVQKAEALATELIDLYGMEATGVRCKRDGRTGSNIKTVVCQHQNLAANGDYIVPVYSSDSLATALKSSSSQESGT